MDHYTDMAWKYLFPRNCSAVLFKEMDFTSHCARMALFRLFSIFVTSASTLVYFPQFAKILNARNSQGISYLAVFLGMISSAGTAAYGFHKGTTFSKYGDSVFLLIQQMLLFTLILYYSTHSSFAFAFIATCWAAMFAVIGQFVPVTVLRAIFQYSVPIGIASKLVQARLNFKNKSTGQLSLPSMFLVVFADLGRCLTKRKEPLQMVGMRGFSVAISLLLLWQFRIYKGKEVAEPVKVKEAPVKPKRREKKKSE